MTTSSAGMNRMPMKVDEFCNTNGQAPSSPIVGDTKIKKSRLQKIRASYSVNNDNNIGKSPLKHLRNKLNKTRQTRRASTGGNNKDADPASPSTSTNNTSASQADNEAPTKPKSSSGRFGRGLKRTTSGVGSKLRQSIRGSVVKGTAMAMKKEPSLVPDVDKKINRSIASKISASLKHRRSSYGDNKKANKSKNKQGRATQSLSGERKPNMDGLTGFSSDAYQPAGSTTVTKKKKKNGKKKKGVSASVGAEPRNTAPISPELAMDLMLNPSVSYHLASPFHTNSDTEEIPLAGPDEPRKKPKRRKKKKRSQSATRASSRDHDSEEEDDYGPSAPMSQQDNIINNKEPLSKREQLMRKGKSEWSSESDLTEKMSGLEARLANLQRMLGSSDSNDTEDEEIYDSEEITVASANDLAVLSPPPPMSPKSPSQLKRLTSKGALFHKNLELFTSTSDSEEEQEEHEKEEDSESDAVSESGSAASFAAGGATSSDDGDDFMNSCEIDFKFNASSGDEVDTSDDEVELVMHPSRLQQQQQQMGNRFGATTRGATTSSEDGDDFMNSCIDFKFNESSGDEVDTSDDDDDVELVVHPSRLQQQQQQMDSRDKRFPPLPTRGRATEPRSPRPRSSPATTHSTVSTDQLPPISPPFRKKRVGAPSRVASIDSTGNILSTSARSNLDEEEEEEEDVTMRRSNSRDHPSRKAAMQEEEEVTLRRSNSHDRPSRTAGFVTLNEDEEFVPLNESSWQMPNTWQSESNLPSFQAITCNKNSGFQSESSLPTFSQQQQQQQQQQGTKSTNKHNVHPLVSPGRGKRKAFKNRAINAGGDLLQTPLVRQSSAPAITTSASSSVSSNASPVVVPRKPKSAKKNKAPPSPRKATSASPTVLRKTVALRRRSKSRDRNAVDRSLNRVGISNDDLQDVMDEQELLSFLTSGRAERKSLPVSDHKVKENKLPHYVTPSRGRKKGLSATLHEDSNKNKRPSLKRFNSTSDTNNHVQQQHDDVTKTPRSSSNISAESPSSPLLEMQGSLEQLKKETTPPFSDARDETIYSDDEDNLVLGAGARRKTKPPPRKTSQLLSDIQQESIEKKHQHDIENDSLLNVLSAAAGDD